MLAGVDRRFYTETAPLNSFRRSIAFEVHFLGVGEGAKFSDSTPVGVSVWSKSNPLPVSDALDSSEWFVPGRARPAENPCNHESRWQRPAAEDLRMGASRRSHTHQPPVMHLEKEVLRGYNESFLSAVSTATRDRGSGRTHRTARLPFEGSSDPQDSRRSRRADELRLGTLDA